jgi:hypothetical protein
MEGKLLTQKVNFFIAATFIAAFGLFMTSKILDAAQLSNPITAAAAQTVDTLTRN